MSKLVGYDFQVEYQKGVENVVADALLRKEEKAELAAISTLVPIWLDTIKEEVLTNLKLQHLVKLFQEGEAVSPWEFKEGVLFFKSRIYLNSDSSLLSVIIQEFHSSTHKGILKTLQRIRSVFFWVGMKKQIQDYIRHCNVCQRHKTECTSPAGLLQPLPIPTKVWSDISMDFVDGLPTSVGKSTIFVVMDRLSRTPILFPFLIHTQLKV